MVQSQMHPHAPSVPKPPQSVSPRPPSRTTIYAVDASPLQRGRYRSFTSSPRPTSQGENYPGENTGGRTSRGMSSPSPAGGKGMAGGPLLDFEIGDVTSPPIRLDEATLPVNSIAEEESPRPHTSRTAPASTGHFRHPTRTPRTMRSHMSVPMTPWKLSFAEAYQPPMDERRPYLETPIPLYMQGDVTTPRRRRPELMLPLLTAGCDGGFALSHTNVNMGVLKQRCCYSFAVSVGMREGRLACDHMHVIKSDASNHIIMEVTKPDNPTTIDFVYYAETEGHLNDEIVFRNEKQIARLKIVANVVEGKDYERLRSPHCHGQGSSRLRGPPVSLISASHEPMWYPTKGETYFVQFALNDRWMVQAREEALVEKSLREEEERVQKEADEKEYAERMAQYQRQRNAVAHEMRAEKEAEKALQERMIREEHERKKAEELRSIAERDAKIARENAWMRRFDEDMKKPGVIPSLPLPPQETESDLAASLPPPKPEFARKGGRATPKKELKRSSTKSSMGSSRSAKSSKSKRTPKKKTKEQPEDELDQSLVGLTPIQVAARKKRMYRAAAELVQNATDINDRILELKHNTIPASAVHEVMKTVLVVLGHPSGSVENWEYCAKAIDDDPDDFRSKVLLVDPADVERDKMMMKLIRGTIKDVQEVEVQKASLPAFVLYEWLAAISQPGSLFVENK